MTEKKTVTITYTTDSTIEFGGYLIPGATTLRTPGFKGWFYRLIKNKKGWYEYSLYDEIVNAYKKRTHRE